MNFVLLGAWSYERGGPAKGAWPLGTNVMVTLWAAKAQGQSHLRFARK